MYISEFDKAEIRQIVEKQLQAFQKDDFIAAFSFASPSIQQQFGTWDNFKQMVISSYRAVYRPRAVIFGSFSLVENFPAQTLTIMDFYGNIIQATYVMQQQSDFSWRIHGCFLSPTDKTLK